MNTPVLRPLPLALLAGTLVLIAAPAAHAQERGRVLSSTPVMQQVAIPRDVCVDRTVTESGQKSGAGALLGGIAGGAAGNAIGGGSGRAAATAIGIIGGAILGDSIEGGGQPQARVVRECSTQTVYENRAVAYDVVYEYAGRQYSVRLAEQPGDYIDLQLNPVGAVPADPPPQYAPQPYAQPYTPQYVAPAYVPPPTYYVPQYVSPPVTRIIVAPDPFYRPPPRVIMPPPVYVRPDRGDHDRDGWRNRPDRRDDHREARREDRPTPPPGMNRPAPNPAPVRPAPAPQRRGLDPNADNDKQ